MSKRKLIETAIPLDAINAACKADKDRKTGSIRNLGKWFAPMPLPAWRALLFAALVDDPETEAERDELLNIIEGLMEDGGGPPSEAAMNRARDVLAKHWPDGVPTVVDPFCGGGSTLVEALRLGLEACGSDLNPVAVLHSRLVAELLPDAANAPAVTTEIGRLPSKDTLVPFDGFRADVLHFATEVREAVQAATRSLYADAATKGRTVAWLWAREADCPNPVCGVRNPLMGSWWLSKKRGAEKWLAPRIEGKDVLFEIAGPAGEPPSAPKQGRGANFACIACGSVLSQGYLAAAGRDGRIVNRLLAIATDLGRADRGYEVPPTIRRETRDANRAEVPGLDNATDDGGGRERFGFDTHRHQYTARQAETLRAFAEEVGQVAARVRALGGTEAYAQAIAGVLGLCVAKQAMYSSCLSFWRTRQGPSKAERAFARHDIPFNWDFAEPNPFGASAGDWMQNVETTLRALDFIPHQRAKRVVQQDARHVAANSDGPIVVATDPPYFGQIAYADLSDFFYPWLRLALGATIPDIFRTIATPKSGELVALAKKHNGNQRAAAAYFIDGFRETFASLSERQHADVPLLVVYASREGESGAAGLGVSSWEAVLESLIGAGLQIQGTWPIHGTSGVRMISAGTNALATYVVLACRPRPETAPRVSRSEFVRILRRELIEAVPRLQHANIAPVDMAQAVIGPGMEVFSRHSAVVETDGTPVSVAVALGLINRALAETLDEQEGDLDPDSRWAATWYEEHGFSPASFGEADQLARAKGISVDALVRAGVVISGGNKVALLSRDQLPVTWDPSTDNRATAWEAVQYLVRALYEEGEPGAASLYSRLGRLADPTRELAYRLYQVAEKNGRTDEAIAYNSLVSSWSEIARLAEDLPATSPEALF